ncbi:MAG TPA: flagellar biosynthesis anti-sigma factor FlgM [Bryobacterales bacterium]|nr:flagellar biosynthesis anti-sigma factor FlgM [Bryobacterales bacterium]
MKVDDSFSPSGVSPSNDLRSRAVGGATPTGGPERSPGVSRSAEGTDSASLSTLGVELSRALAQDPPEMVARLGKLQEAVANGTYTVPSELVSAKIVAATLVEQ